MASFSSKAQLPDRKKALPAHSVQPHQLQIIEELEDQRSVLEKEIAGCRMA
ncbi:conserved domain protein [delta proteobacterium NaphS2]|nr:conserved domain protein [delta proteobacterium NaphS2]